MLRVARFLASYLRDPPPAVLEEEVALATGEGEAAALLFRPRGGGRFPGWVVLHGITVAGMRHPSMLRFARSVAGAGGVVLVPEVKEWAGLDIAPDRAPDVIASGARYLAARPEVREGGVGVVGCSFGATQALMAAARPEVAEGIRSVVGFGAYADLRRTLTFMLTGEHEWQGARLRLDPDPYGRWIVAANYLTAAPRFRGMEAVARAARELAAEAGRRFVYAGDPEYDPLKAELRGRLRPEERAVWDLIAPPTDVRPDPAAARALAEELLAAALRVHPGLDPGPALPRLRSRVVLAHGQDDRLIPFTETLRLASRIPPEARAVVRITRLFSHSRGATGLRWMDYPGELWRYLSLLQQALR